MSITQADLDNWFIYHPPANEEQKRAYGAIRAAGKYFAQTILDYAPASADQTTAIRTVREAVMWANAAIACHSAPEVELIVELVAPPELVTPELSSPQPPSPGSD